MRWLALILCALPVCAWADYRSDYREGVAAAERTDWPRVQTLMNRALAEQSTPGEKIRLYGMVYAPYVPQFFLGLAAFSQNNCTEALKWLEDARVAGAAPGLSRGAERRTMMVERCRARLANEQKPAAPIVAQTPAPVATPPKPAAAPPKPVAANTTPVPVASPPPAAAASLDVGRLQAARRRMSNVDLALAAVNRGLADPALADQQAGWKQRRDPIAAQAQRAQAQLREIETRRDGAALSALDAELTTLETRSAGLSKEVAVAGERARVVALAQARSDLVARIRPRLQPMVESFLRGDYPTVAAWADDPALKAVPPAYAQALLIRAAARYELYVLGGERELVKIEAARQDVRSVRGLAGELRPSTKLFSPRFCEFFDSTR